MNTEIIIATLWVFIGEFYGNFVGGGSLVTQITLQNILWIDIKRAMALDNAAVIGSNLGMIIIMIRKYSIKKWFPFFVIFQSLWAIMWAWVLVHINPELLKIIFIIAVILLVVKNLFIEDKKNEGSTFTKSYKNITLLCLAGVFIWVYNAAFVIWDWIVALLIMTSLFHFKYHYAIFILAISSLFAQSVAVHQYYLNWLLDISFLIPMIIATLIWGTLCATLLEKIHSDKMEKFLKYLSVLLVWYLIFWLL